MESGSDHKLRYVADSSPDAVQKFRHESRQTPPGPDYSVDLSIAANAAASAAVAAERQAQAEAKDRNQLIDSLRASEHALERMRHAKDSSPIHDSRRERALDISTLARQLARSEHQVSVLQVRIEREHSQSAALQAELEESRQLCEQLSAALREQGSAANGRLQAQLDHCRSQLQVANERIQELQEEDHSMSRKLQAALGSADFERSSSQQHKEALTVVRESLNDARQEVIRAQQQADEAIERAQKAEEQAQQLQEQLKKRGTAMDISQRMAWDRDLRTAVERAVTAAKQAWSHSLEQEVKELKNQLARAQLDVTEARREADRAQEQDRREREKLQAELQTTFSETTGLERQRIREQILALRDAVEDDSEDKRLAHRAELRRQLQFSLKAASCFRLAGLAARHALKLRTRGFSRWLQVMYGQEQARRARIATGMWYMRRQRHREAQRTILRYWHALARVRGCGTEQTLLQGLVGVSNMPGGTPRGPTTEASRQPFAMVPVTMTPLEDTAGASLAPAHMPPAHMLLSQMQQVSSRSHIAPLASMTGRETRNGFEGTLHTPFQLRHEQTAPGKRQVGAAHGKVKYEQLNDRPKSPGFRVAPSFRTKEAYFQGSAPTGMDSRGARDSTGASDSSTLVREVQSNGAGLVLAVVLGSLTQHQSQRLRPSSAELLLHSARAIEDAQYARKMRQARQGLLAGTRQLRVAYSSTQDLEAGGISSNQYASPLRGSIQPVDDFVLGLRGLPPQEQRQQTRSLPHQSAKRGPVRGWIDDWDTLEYAATRRAPGINPQMANDYSRMRRRMQAASSPSELPWGGAGRTVAAQIRFEKGMDSPSNGVAIQHQRERRRLSADGPDPDTAELVDSTIGGEAADAALPSLIQLREKRAKLRAAMQPSDDTRKAPSAPMPGLGPSQDEMTVGEIELQKLDLLIEQARQASPRKVGIRRTAAPTVQNIVELHAPKGVALPMTDGQTIAAPSTVALGAIPRLVVRLREQRPPPSLFASESARLHVAPKQSLPFRMSRSSRLLFVEGKRLQGVARLAGLMRRLYMQQLHRGFIAWVRHPRGDCSEDEASTGQPSRIATSHLTRDEEMGQARKELQASRQAAADAQEEARALRQALETVSARLRKAIKEKGNAERALLATGAT